MNEGVTMDMLDELIERMPRAEGWQQQVVACLRELKCSRSSGKKLRRQQVEVELASCVESLDSMRAERDGLREDRDQWKQACELSRSNHARTEAMLLPDARRYRYLQPLFWFRMAVMNHFGKVGREVVDIDATIDSGIAIDAAQASSGELET